MISCSFYFISDTKSHGRGSGRGTNYTKYKLTKKLLSGTVLYANYKYQSKNRCPVTLDLKYIRRYPAFCFTAAIKFTGFLLCDQISSYQPSDDINVTTKGTEVKWASHYYIYFINQYYAGGLLSFISLLISFVSFFQICNSLFSICQVTDLFQRSHSPLEDPTKLKYSV